MTEPNWLIGAVATVPVEFSIPKVTGSSGSGKKIEGSKLECPETTCSWIIFVPSCKTNCKVIKLYPWKVGTLIKFTISWRLGAAPIVKYSIVPPAEGFKSVQFSAIKSFG